MLVPLENAPLLATLLGVVFGWVLTLLSVFLILVVLVQRGRGGGLTGALGGAGGQSAFGSKAGDTFTRLTFGVAGLWIFLCASAMYFLGNARTARLDRTQPPTLQQPAGTDEAPGAFDFDFSELEGFGTDPDATLDPAPPADPQAAEPGAIESGALEPGDAEATDLQQP